MDQKPPPNPFKDLYWFKWGESMKPKPFSGLRRWASEHPVKSHMTAFLVPTIIGLAATYDELFIAGICLTAMLTLWMAGSIIRDTRYWLLILALMVSSIPAKAQETKPQGAPAAACVVVIVVGSIAVYQLYKVCKKKFSPPPPATNKPPDELVGFLNESSGDTYAGTSCANYIFICQEDGSDDLATIQPLDTNQPIRVSIAARLVEIGGAVTVEPIKLTMRPDSELLDRAEYERRINALGLNLCLGGGCAPSYSRNGLPSNSEEVPIIFDYGSGGIPKVTIGRDVQQYPIVIERSVDLQSWRPIIETLIPSGQTVVFGDDPDIGSAFYRMREL